MTGKRRPRTHIIADLAVNFVERQILLTGNTVERVRNVYGIDIFMRTFDRNGVSEPGLVGIQVKATDAIRLIPSSQSVATRVEVVHLNAWIAEVDPVILVAYDAATDVAYWIDIQERYGRLRLTTTSKRVTVHVPTANVFDPTAVVRIAANKNRNLARRERETFGETPQ